jgi:hypothetical protein
MFEASFGFNPRDEKAGELENLTDDIEPYVGVGPDYVIMLGLL